MAMWANYVHPDDRHRLRHLHLQWATLHEHAVREGEYRIRDANGAYRWFLAARRSCPRHADGTVSHVLGALIDITETKQAMQALRERDVDITELIEAITPITGPNFFRSLADHLAETCQVDYACVVLLDADDPMRGQTIALSLRGQAIEDVSYDLRGTPCEEVAGGISFTGLPGLQQEFPLDTALVDMRAESYMGIPLFAANRYAARVDRAAPLRTVRGAGAGAHDPLHVLAPARHRGTRADPDRTRAARQRGTTAAVAEDATRSASSPAASPTTSTIC